jgi:hypothetical protein
MVLLEREQPLAILADAVAAASRSEGRLVVVSAEAGGGKTTLLQEFAPNAGAARVLWGACDDLLTPIPFGPLLDLSRSSDPGLEQALTDGEREKAFSRLLDVLERRPHPSLVVLEDVHWIDQASADLLTAVVQRIHHLAVAMVMTVRPEGLTADHPARRIAWHAPAVDRVELAPLSVDAVASIVGPRMAEEVMRASGGNPYFVAQLIDSGGSVTPDVTEVVRSRAAGLPAGTVSLLEVVSTSPTGIEGFVLDRVSPGWEDEIEPAEVMRLVDVSPAGVGFRHGLARQAFESAMTASRRRACHAAVLQAVLDVGLAPARVVHHAAGAGAVDVILQVGPVAATQARAAGSHREAAAHYRRVLEHAHLLDEVTRAEMEEAYSLEAWTIDDPEEAVASARRALALRRQTGGPSAAIGRNLRRIARVCWFMGDAETAERHLEEAVAALVGGTDEDRLELASVLGYRGLMAGIRDGYEPARPWIDRAVALIEGSSDLRLQALVLNDVGTVRYLHEGDPTDLIRSIELAAHVGLHIDVVRGHVNLASCALGHRRYDDARRHLADAAAYATDHQVAAFEALAGAVLAQVAFETGDWDTADVLTGRVMEHESFARLPASIVHARLQVRRGDHDAGEAIADALAMAERTGEAQRVVPAMGAAAEHAWMLERLSTVVPALERAHELALRSGSPRFIGETSIWLQAAGRLDEIPHRIEPAARLLLEGRWQEAAAAWERQGNPYEAASPGSSTTTPMWCSSDWPSSTAWVPRPWPARPAPGSPEWASIAYPAGREPPPQRTRPVSRPGRWRCWVWSPMV